MIRGKEWKGEGRSAENKREMYGRKDLICSCRVCFRLGGGEEGEVGEINIHKRPGEVSRAGSTYMYLSPLTPATRGR